MVFAFRSVQSSMLQTLIVSNVIATADVHVGVFVIAQSRIAIVGDA